MKILYNRKLDSNGWREIKTFEYSAILQYFDKPSNYGIDNGRISRLWIKKMTKPQEKILAYERDWDKQLSENASREAKDLYDFIIKKYN